MVWKIPFVVAEAQANNYRTLIDAGTTNPGARLLIYDDTGGVPAGPEVAITSQVLLATVELQNPATAVASDLNPDAAIVIQGLPLSDISIDADGTAAFGRLTNRDNAVIGQGLVATSSAEIIVSTVNFVQLARFDLIDVSRFRVAEG